LHLFIKKTPSLFFLVSVRNTGSAALGMVVAIIGIPGGLQVRVDKMRELLQVLPPFTVGHHACTLIATTDSQLLSTTPTREGVDVYRTDWGDYRIQA
jgi:hypothetical protein